MHYTDPDIREHARAMRRNPTSNEQRIWNWLRSRRFGDFKFRRQHPIGRYILDFYCPALRLAIEIDGAQHGDPRVASVDETRAAVLRGFGIEVVRVSNRDLACDSVTVAQTIQWAIERRSALDARPSPLQRG
jgi:very-short-patch-repair endonuclease